jgi:hypothetical protein
LNKKEFHKPNLLNIEFSPKKVKNKTKQKKRKEKKPQKPKRRKTKRVMMKQRVDHHHCRINFEGRFGNRGSDKFNCRK